MRLGTEYLVEASARTEKDGRDIATLRRRLGNRWGSHPMQSTQIRRQNKERREGDEWNPGWTKYHLAAKLLYGEKVALVGTLGEPTVWIAEGFYREMLLKSGYDRHSFPPLWG